MANVEEKILDIKVRYDDAIRAISQYQTKIDDLKKREAELKKELKDDKISRAEYNAEMAKSKTDVQENCEAIRILNKEIQNNRKIQRELESGGEGSLKSLRAELSNLTAEYDNLSRAERNSSKGKELQENINAITDELKEAEQETQRFYRNVGNYEDAIQNAIAANVPFIDSIIRMNEIGGDAAVTFKGMTQGAVAFGKQLLVLLANPVVAIFAAVSVLLLSIAKGIKSSEENTQRWNVVLAPFRMLLDAVGKGMQVLASGILSVAETGDKMMGWITKQMEKLPLLGKYVKVVNDENERYVSIAKEQAAIDRDTRNLQVENAKNALKIATLKAQADDELNVSAEERMKAIREANKLEEEASKKNYDLAKRRYELLVQQNAMAENTKETNDAIAQAEIEMYNALTEYQDKRGELLGREVALANEIKTAEKEKSDAIKAMREKELEEIRKAEDESLKLLKEGRKKQTLAIEYEYGRQIEDLKQRLAEEENLTPNSRKAIIQQIEFLEKQKTQALQKLDDEELEKELENRQKLISLQLEAVKEGSEQEYQLRMQQLVAARDAELNEKELTEQMKLAIVAKYNKQMDDLSARHDAEILQKQQDAIRVRFETEIAQAYGNEQEILRIKLEQKQAELDAIHQLEGESTEAFNLRKIEMQNEYLAAKQELANKEIEIEQAKYEVAASIAGGLSSVFETLGEDNKAFAILSKTLALAEIAINTGKAIAAGVAQSQSVPYPGNLIAIATTVATVLSNIAVAVNTVKSAKFATGGKVVGPGSGTSDSVPAMLSNGESVLTAAATSMFAPLLSSFNQMGGGVPINVTESSNQALGEDMLARAVAKGVMMAPPPVVSVEEFTSVANRVKYVENLGDV